MWDLKYHAERLLWRIAPAEAPRLLLWAQRTLRFPFALLRDVLEGQLTLRAMSLVYTTLLSIVPLIAFSFSVLKGFGVHHEIRPLLVNLLLPLGPKGVEIADGIIGFVDRVRVDVLGAVGLVFLIGTVLSLIQKIEEACNYVWQVDRSRSFARRISEYLSILLIGPVLMVAALALIATITSSAVMSHIAAIEPFGTTLLLAGKLTPFVLVILTFTFVYGYVPNTRVRLSSALVGGATAGVLWTLAGKLFASFIATSTQYTAIYSGFAIGIVALIWLHLSWLILLLGADVAFYWQHPLALRRGRSAPDPAGGTREQLALAVMYLVGSEFARGRPGWTVPGLVAHLGMPGRELGSVLRALHRRGLIIETEDSRYVPARDLGSIQLREVLAAVRESQGDHDARPPAPVTMVAGEIDGAIASVLGERTVRDLIDGGS
jgi:membrane protein